MIAMFLAALFAGVTACNNDQDGERRTPLVPPAEQFALVMALEAGRIVFDPAEILSGEAARSAAVEDGFIGEGESLPNDFYIRNPSVETRSLPAAPGFTATLLDAETLEPAKAIDFEMLARLFSGEDSAEGYYGFVPDQFPMYLSLQDEDIVSARQLYLP